MTDCKEDEKAILVRVHTPDEGYHDVCDELIFSDFEENPKAFKCTLADDYISRTSAEWKALERLYEATSQFCNPENAEFSEDLYPNLLNCLKELDRIRKEGESG